MALADCKGDKARELNFSKGEVIVVTREEDEQNWVSTTASVKSLFPAWVRVLSRTNTGPQTKIISVAPLITQIEPFENKPFALVIFMGLRSGQEI